MTLEEKFLFDLQGFLVIKNVLTPGEVAELNDIADEKSPRPPETTGQRTATEILLWGPAYQALIDHSKIVPYLVEMIGPRFRLDHEYGIFMDKGDTRGPLHGGEGGMDDWWYRCRSGVIRNGLCALTYFLTSAAAGEGGFVCIPGSHKSNFVELIPEEVKQFEHLASYLVQPIIEAGDAVLFTEALVHGTMPWLGEHERRVLIYKYNPGHCASSGNRYNLQAFSSLTEQQRRILSPPALYGRPAVVDQ